MPEVKKTDVVIIGAGPAGLAAALYARRSLLETVVVEREAVGGQMTLTSEVDNYPGVPRADAFELVEQMKRQARDFGAHLTMGRAQGLEPAGTRFLVTTAEDVYDAGAVILAGGATPRQAGFAGETEFRGHGVSYCATCDGMFYRGKEVFVIGGGDTAAEEALFLTRFASHVTMVVRKDHLRAQPALVSEVMDNAKIDIRFNSRVARLEGDMLPESITFENTVSGQEEVRRFEKGSFGVFVFVGRNPESGIADKLVERDAQGYIMTDEFMRTATPGLFAAGDIRQKPLRQIVTAASDGAIAAASAASYLGRRLDA